MAVKSASGAPATLPAGAPAAKPGFWAWLNRRLPVEAFIETQLTGYYAPKNFNIWYYFGSIALVVLVLQLATGIVLTMFYKVGEATSFDSVEYIMREVNFGWLLRYLHSTGASAFFIVVYLHMFRAFLYGSYKKPRELLWLFGMAVYLALMAEAFMGYVLPWGNMSFWGAQVIVNLFGTIPGIGPGLVEWIRGDYGIADATLNRFFALHVALLPLALLLLVVLHLVALHETGSNNPDGIEIHEKVGPDGKPLDGIPFHPYYSVKDVVGIAVFFVLFAIVVFFVPNLGGLFLEAPNFEPANPLSTPEHIAPVWYFTPFYAILRAVPDQQRNVRDSFSQRRHLDRYDIEPVEEIFAEFALRHECIQIAMRCREHPYVHGNRLIASDAFDFTFLQRYAVVRSGFPGAGRRPRPEKLSRRSPIQDDRFAAALRR